MKEEEFMSLSTRGQRTTCFDDFLRFDQVNKTQISLYSDSKFQRKLSGEEFVATFSLESTLLVNMNLKIFQNENDVSDLDYTDTDY